MCRRWPHGTDSVTDYDFINFSSLAGRNQLDSARSAVLPGAACRLRAPRGTVGRTASRGTAEGTIRPPEATPQFALVA